MSAPCPSLGGSSRGACPEAFARLDVSATRNLGSVCPRENSLHHVEPEGGPPTLLWLRGAAVPRGLRFPGAQGHPFPFCFMKLENRPFQ